MCVKTLVSPFTWFLNAVSIEHKENLSYFIKGHKQKSVHPPYSIQLKKLPDLLLLFKSMEPACKKDVPPHYLRVKNVWGGFSSVG